VPQAAAASGSNTTGARDGHALPKFEYIAAAATTDRNGSLDLCKKTVCARAFTVGFGTMKTPLLRAPAAACIIIRLTLFNRVHIICTKIYNNKII